jgi:ankyrin repeat protein
LFQFRYPCLLTAHILVQCGADVNATDAIRNTPLHVLVSSWSICNEDILQFLCDNGAHLDCVNVLRETAIDAALNVNTMQLLKSKMKLCLKCLCARIIQNNNVPFHGKISISLVKFVEQH